MYPIEMRWKSFGALFLSFLATLLPYCLTVFAYSVIFVHNKNNVGVYLSIFMIETVIRQTKALPDS